MKGKQLRFFGADEDKGSSKRKTITCPLDTLILLAVVVSLLFILSYSLGVEKGRGSYVKANHAEVTLATQTGQAGLALPKINIVSMNTNKETKQPQAKQTIPPEKTQTFSEASSQTTTDSFEKKYAIQLATCTKEISAQEEVKKLQKQGFPAYAAKKNNFIVVYAGTFKDKAQAEKNMEVLKKTYKDCILRRL